MGSRKNQGQGQPPALPGLQVSFRDRVVHTGTRFETMSIAQFVSKSLRLGLDFTLTSNDESNQWDDLAADVGGKKLQVELKCYKSFNQNLENKLRVSLQKRQLSDDVYFVFYTTADEPAGKGSSPRRDLAEEYLLSNVAHLVLNCLSRDRDFEIRSDEESFKPWDNIVAQIGDVTVCTVVSHAENFNCKLFFSNHLPGREKIRENNGLADPYFVYYKTSADQGTIQKTFAKLDEKDIPEILLLMISDTSKVWREQIKDPQGNLHFTNTFMCMKQKVFFEQEELIRENLKSYLDLDLSSSDQNEMWLSHVKEEFFKFIREWYHSGRETLNSNEVRCAISDYILQKHRINPKRATSDSDFNSDGIKQLMEAYPLVVVNQRLKSKLEEHVWAMNVPDAVSQSEHELKRLWYEGEYHLPLRSEDGDSDKMILLALRIRRDRPRVILIRFFRFRVDPAHHVSLLDGLRPNGSILCVPESEERDSKEEYRVCEVVDEDLDADLHEDSFSHAIRSYFPPFRPVHSFIEALDEESYVNDFHRVVGEAYAWPAIQVCMRTPNVNIRYIKQVLDMGAKINDAIHGGIAPLHRAVLLGREDLVRLFLERDGVRLGDGDFYGDTPLHLACKKNHAGIVELLLGAGANVDRVNVKGFKPDQLTTDDLIKEMLLRKRSA